ncbi:glycogen synthase [Granulicella sibirica]|uniref:Putative glycogen synthase, ADP-glucose transglucosylase n=1 Tax=Granulicella sibirica TaxID=2479048 RepID=A0A4Q0SWI7_9BACT|nr:glycogen synthase [Granulicella sibirica]RXH55157.1 putative glycogen synthase, ADP-glucose transglucosylase [Granulicella sibirica]
MRVGLMTREYPPNVYGGAGVHVEYLSREMAKLIEVEVHAWGKQDMDTGVLKVIGEEPWSAISEGTTAKFKASLEALSLNLLQMTSLGKIDVVHTHTWYVSMAGFWAKKLFGIPFVLTTHSLEPLRAWKAEQLGSGYQMSSWMERTAILDADAVIAVSHGTKADIIKAYPDVSPEKIHVIYNGIDLDEYQKTASTASLTKYGIDPAKPYVLFVGRITRQKGVTHLVDAIKYMPADVQVVLCAGAPDTPEIAAEMRAKVETAREQNPNIFWIEQMVTKPETIELYSHCAVFCCPSVYEPFGIINLEAMACRAPVVASATGGILEVVVENETGYLVPFEADPVTTFPSNPEQFSKDLAAKVTAVLEDPAKAKAFGEAGRRRVEDTFAWSAIATQTVALYRSLLAEMAEKK